MDLSDQGVGLFYTAAPYYPLGAFFHTTARINLLRGLLALASGLILLSGYIINTQLVAKPDFNGWWLFIFGAGSLLLIGESFSRDAIVSVHEIEIAKMAFGFTHFHC